MILPQPLREIRRRYVAFPGPSVDHNTVKCRADHFASAVRFAMNRPAVLRRLRSVTDTLLGIEALEPLLAQILDTATDITRADSATLHLLEPDTQQLRLVAQHGFDAAADIDAAVLPSGGKPGDHDITDTTSPVHPTRDAAVAIRTTPLRSYVGQPVGVLRTQCHRGTRLSPGDLWTVQLLGDIAGQAIASRLLGVSEVETIGHAMIDALLTSGEEHADAREPALPRTVDSRGVAESAAPSGSVTMSEFAGDLIARLFSVGLTLQGTCTLTREPRARERTAEAIAELDETIRHVHRTIYNIRTEDELRR